MPNEKQCKYKYNKKESTFKINIDIYPPDELERLIYDHLCVAHIYSIRELEEISQLSGKPFMSGLEILDSE